MTAPLSDLFKLSPDELVRKITELTEEVSQLREQLSEVTRTAFFDRLTDLPNRHGYDRYVNALQSLSRTEEFQTSLDGGRAGGLLVAQIDIDHFKDINTMLTHFGGDMVLKLFAGRIAQCARVNALPHDVSGMASLRCEASLRVEEYLSQRGMAGTDLISRWGGEEFFCLFPLCYKDKQAARAVYDDADNIVKRLMNVIRNQPFAVPINEATYNSINKSVLGKVKQYYHDAKLVDDRGKRIILPISASIGFAVISWEEFIANSKEDPSHLFRNVADLMRRAKEGGRNRAVTVRSGNSGKPAVYVYEGKELYKMNTADIVQ